ncbi:MAG: hypothetical protein WC246_00465 [Candidatus Paceibacterota bacterium]|jgi:hypothetical protein
MVIWYFVRGLAFSIIFFLKHWYLDGFFAVVHGVGRILGALEKQLALKINLYFIFEPLYQERNIYGYAIGFVYRLFKLLFGGLLYAFLVVCGLVGYIIWALIPLYSIYRIIYG